ncbi:MAG: hypothetical protein AABY46_03725, partial [Nitrospirota bacterium]
MNEPKRKTGLRKKLVWATLLVGVLPVVLGLILTYLKGTEALRKALGADFAGLAREAASKADLVIGQEIDEMTTLAASAEVLEAVARANRTYDGRPEAVIQEHLTQSSRNWEKTQRNLEKRHPILTGPAAAYLRKVLNIQEESLAHIALYLTDRRGALVASINDFPAFLSAQAE